MFPKLEPQLRSIQPRLIGLISILILSTASLFSVQATLAANVEQEPSQEELVKQLQALEAEINKFKQTLEQTQGEKSSLEDELENNDKNINELLKKIQEMESDLHKGEIKLSRLINEQKELQSSKSEQQQYIARQIRAAYEMGNQEYLKVLLNQEDPNQISRMLTYYDHFNRARADQVQAYSRTIVQLKNVSGLIEAENTSLEEGRNKLQQERSDVIKVQLENRVVIKALALQITAAGAEIKKRTEDREQLEALIEKIQAGILNLATPADVVAFQSLKGQLTLPVAGKISHRYGHKRNAGKLKWNGVVIEAPEGEPVAAVHYGRVVFSDWLRGFGLLLIINHGEGYMSLYGHNQVLYRESGDWVTAGETIAAVGNSGGQNQSGLYFEIRANGKTADPQRWCQARTKHAA
jgi:murein hydrolase activator